MSSSEEFQVKIRDWLLQDGYTVEEQTQEGLHWFLVATGQSGTGFGISQRAGVADEIYIRLTLEFDKPVQSALARMPADSRTTFYSEVRFYLLSVGVEFQPEGEPIWKRLTISERIFEDALTKDEFIRRLFNVHRGAVGVGWLFNEALPDVPPTQTKATGTIH